MTEKTKDTATDPKAWPAWRYGPDGIGKIFERPEDVPKGYVNHPKDVPSLDL
jgi:hypothetical protein